MTKTFKRVALSMFLIGAAMPVLAEGIDVPTLTCGDYMAMSSGDRLLAVNAVKNFAADSKNANMTEELKAIMIGETDFALQQKVESSCLGKDVNLTVFDLLMMN